MACTARVSMDASRGRLVPVVVPVLLSLPVSPSLPCQLFFKTTLTSNHRDTGYHVRIDSYQLQGSRRAATRQGTVTRATRVTQLRWLGEGGDVADNHLSTGSSLHSRPAVKALDGCQERHLLFLARQLVIPPPSPHPPPCSLATLFPFSTLIHSDPFRWGFPCFVCRLPAFL